MVEQEEARANFYESSTAFEEDKFIPAVDEIVGPTNCE